MNQPNYLIIDLKTGFYDGAYTDLTTAIEVYKRKKESDPQAGWMLVEEVMRTDNIKTLPEHTFYPNHLSQKADIIEYIKSQLESDDSDHDADAENIYSYFVSRGFDAILYDALGAIELRDRLDEIGNQDIPEWKDNGPINSFDMLAAELPYDEVESV